MKRKNGFTIIEILVVLGIIGLLSVFLVPKLFGARDAGKEAAVKLVMHNVQLAIEAYQMENTVYPQGSNISLEDLAKNYLMGGTYLAQIPDNPFTGQPYKAADVAGKIVYKYDSTNGTYVLEGYNRTGLKKIQELSNM